jgi:hypothetical protein
VRREPDRLANLWSESRLPTDPFHQLAPTRIGIAEVPELHAIPHRHRIAPTRFWTVTPPPDLWSEARERANSAFQEYTRLLVPTVHREGPYRFFFYSADRHEPAHVHVERDASRAKFWLAPVRLARSGGFDAAELMRLGRLVVEREQQLLRAWDEYFTTTE